MMPKGWTRRPELQPLAWHVLVNESWPPLQAGTYDVQLAERLRAKVCNRLTDGWEALLDGSTPWPDALADVPARERPAIMAKALRAHVDWFGRHAHETQAAHWLEGAWPAEKDLARVAPVQWLLEHGVQALAEARAARWQDPGDLFS